MRSLTIIVVLGCLASACVNAQESSVAKHPPLTVSLNKALGV